MNPSSLLRPSHLTAGVLLLDRVRLLQANRVRMDAAGDARAAVRDAKMVVDLLDTATSPVLQAALMVATTPELHTLPVVVGPPQPTPTADVLLAVVAYGAACADFRVSATGSDRVQDALQTVREMLDLLALAAVIAVEVEQQAGPVKA